MSVLSGFPMVSQLTTVTEDGLPNKDAPFECVAASLCAGCMWLNGVQHVGGEYTPDWFKDQAYSENYEGGTEARKYVEVCAHLGVKLYPVDGTPGQLVELAKQHLAAGHPVVFTEPDPYVDTSLPQYAGWSHVCVFYADNGQGLTAMDPYIARPVYRSYASWLNLLLFNELWILEKGEQDVTIDLNTPEVARYFELFDGAGKQWKCRQTGKVIQYAILDYYRNNGAKPLCGLSSLGLPITNEIPLQGVAGGVMKQHFERGVLCYDPQHKVDNPPLAGDVYPLHLYSGPGQDPAIAELEQEIQKLNAQLAQPGVAQAQVEALQKQVASLQGRLDAIKTVIAAAG